MAKKKPKENAPRAVGQASQQNSAQNSAPLVQPPNLPDAPKQSSWHTLLSPKTVRTLLIAILGALGAGSSFYFSFLGSSSQQQINNSPQSTNLQAAGDINVTVNPPPSDVKETVEKLLEHYKSSVDESVRNSVKETVEQLLKEERSRKGGGELEEAVSQLRHGKTDAAKKIFSETLNRKLAEGKAAQKEAAAAAMHLGTLAQLSDNEEAIKFYKQATNLDADNLEAWNRLANVLQRKGDRKQAEKTLDRVMKFARKNKDTDRQAMTLHNLGIIHLNEKKLDLAEQDFKEALALNQSRGRQTGTARNYNSLAIVLREKHQLGEAKDMVEKSIEIYKRIEILTEDEYFGLSDSYSTLAIIFLQLGEITQSEQCFCRSLRMNVSKSNRGRLATDYLNLGILYETIGSPLQAAAFYRTSLRLAEEVKLSQLHHKAETLLSKLPRAVVEAPEYELDVCNTPVIK